MGMGVGMWVCSAKKVVREKHKVIQNLVPLEGRLWQTQMLSGWTIKYTSIQGIVKENEQKQTYKDFISWNYQMQII